MHIWDIPSTNASPMLKVSNMAIVSRTNTISKGLFCMAR
jgi:hypothetical protein